LNTLVDGNPPVTFGQLATAFKARGLTREQYAAFGLPLSYDDILNPHLADELVAYRRLIALING
jgi:hypothetical protein